ncbi:MAG: hypothetical protein NVS1B3_06910 [Candidatus Dormibacteraceae bacterium]
MLGFSAVASEGGSIWRRASVALTVIAVLLPYSIWVATGLRNGTAQDFIHIGHEAINKSQASAKISGAASHYHYFGEYGGDGQFQFFIAVDPVNARYYLDSPAYRYTRILYPTLAGIAALQRPDLVPYTLLFVNLLMIGIGTLALAAWLRRHGVTAYLAAVFGFYPGIYISLQQDLTEITAYAFVAVAIYLFDFGGRHRLVLSGVAFALALLTREVTALFGGVYVLGVLFGGEGPLARRPGQNWRWAMAWAAIAFAPLLAWKAFLLWWLGSLGLEPLIAPIPFAGIASLWPWASEQVEELRTIVVPGIICGLAAAWAISRGVRALPVWTLLINVLVLIVFLGRLSYVDISSSGRVTIGVALAAVLSVPYLLPRARGWFWATTALWLTPMVFWFFLPVAQDSASHLLHWVRRAIHSA